MLVIQQMDDATGPFAARYDLRTGAEQTQQTQGGRLLDHIHCVAGHQQFRYVIWERFGHITTANVGNALQCQIHVNRIPWVQIIFNALNDQFD